MVPIANDLRAITVFQSRQSGIAPESSNKKLISTNLMRSERWAEVIRFRNRLRSYPPFLGEHHAVKFTRTASPNSCVMRASYDTLLACHDLNRAGE